MNATINLLFLGIVFCAPFNDCFSIKLTLPFEQSDSSITCDFDCYYFKDGSPHGGIDYQFPNGLKSKGHPIVASASGFAVASTSTKAGGYGNLVEITHDDNSDGHVWKTRYAHLESFSPVLQIGKQVYVERGQVIGYCGNSGGPWPVNSGSDKQPYHLHFEVLRDNIKVDPYAEKAYLWSTNPASYFYFTNETSFDYKLHASQGWKNGFDTQLTRQDQKDINTWMILANGANPGVVSPAFAKGITTDQFKTLAFSARINKVEQASTGTVWLKNQEGNWNHECDIAEVYKDMNYHEYKVGLGHLSIMEISQLSIELTDNAINEFWIFDWVKLLSSYKKWDFKDNQLGWVLKNGNTKCFCIPGNITIKEQWEIDPDLDIQLISPCFESLIAEENAVLKVAMSSGKCQPGKNIMKIYFKTDLYSEFSEERTVTTPVVDDGKLRVYTIDMSANSFWKGRITQIRIDPLLDGYPENTDNIRIDYIAFEQNMIKSISKAYLTEAVPLSVDKIALNYAMTELPVLDYKVNLFQDGKQINSSTGFNNVFNVSNLTPGKEYAYALTTSVNDNGIYYESEKSDPVLVSTLSTPVLSEQSVFYADASLR